VTLTKEKVTIPVENTPADTAKTGQKLKTESELKSLRGELDPGYQAFVPLDDKGNPSGPAEDWEPGKPQAAVFAPPPHPSDELVTPSGAPITNQMNPNPDFGDVNLLERNPIGGTAQPPKETDAQAQQRMHSAMDAKVASKAPATSTKTT
jgi:hypothetical protein